MSHPLPDHAHPIVTAVRRFVETEVLPVASSLEHADAYPHDLVARMRALGLFGALIPEAHGGLGLSVSTYARVIEELCGGFMSLAGVINSHTPAPTCRRSAPSPGARATTTSSRGRRCS